MDAGRKVGRARRHRDRRDCGRALLPATGNLDVALHWRTPAKPMCHVEGPTPRADIFCRDCLESDRARCDIQAMHTEECRPDTRWFPSPPPTAPV